MFINAIPDETLCEWAENDCRLKTGIDGIKAKITSKANEFYEITLTDEEGNIVDVYTIDPEIAVGTDSDKEAVYLPQTGNNSATNRMIVLMALLMIGTGLVLLGLPKRQRRGRQK